MAYDKYIVKAEKAAEKLAGLTPGKKLVVRSPGAFTQWVNDRLSAELEIENAQAATVESLLTKKIPVEVKKACELRQILSPSAPKKLKALINQTDENGIARHQLTYYGAHTGRWSGRGIQPQNIQRNCVSEADFPNVLKTFCSGKSNAKKAGELIRPLITARKGKALIIRDYAQNELRVLLWLVGHKDELKIITDPTRDLYKHFAANNIYNVSFDKVTKQQRYVGKTAILGLGYGMGKVRFRDTIGDGIYLPAPMCEKIVNSYRNRFNRVVVFWKAVEKAFMSSAPVIVNLTDNPNTAIKFYNRGRSRRILLPSGRELNYFKVSYKSDDQFRKSAITYEGRRGKVYVWGGVITENIVQATSRDILAEGTLECLKIAGVDPVLTVHDEIIFETDQGMKGQKGRVKQKAQSIDTKLQRGPKWTVGLPLEVEGAEGVVRYGK